VGRRGFSRGFSPSFSRGVLPAPGRVRAKKSSGPAAASADIAGCSCRGPEQHFYVTTYSRVKGHSAASSRAFRACGGRTRAQPHGLTPLRGFSQWFAGRVLLTDLSFSGESPSPPAGAAGSGGADIAPRLRGRPRPSLLRPGSPGWGLPAPGQTRVAVHEDEDGPPGATAISPDLRPSRAPPDSACHPPQTDGVAALACTGERRSRSEPARSARPTPSHQADY
jgi:hypothetical protein